jgi:hypothetical protein
MQAFLIALSNTPLLHAAVLRRFLVILSVSFGCLTAQAGGDDRFGFATHFEQGWSYTAMMPPIAACGVSYVRDDLYAGHWEISPGVYVQPAFDLGWLNAAKANGLKVVGILGPNGNYANNYDPVAMANLAVWIARTGLVTAFEITNEPNNAYAAYVGSGSIWQAKLVALSNAVAAAVHALNPSIQVIGLDGQGGQIFNMLVPGTTINGVVYHPYPNSNFIPETTYEWQYLDYGSWIQALVAKTTLPKWETEWGIGTWSSFNQTNQAVFIARRLLQESGLGVEHSFIYEFADNGSEPYGVESMNPMTPKRSYSVVQRIISTLAGVKGGTSFVTVNSVANGNLADVKAFAYQGSINKTVMAFWFGNHDPRTPPAASTCQLTLTVANPITNSYLMSAPTGTTVPLSSYQTSWNGTQLTITGLPITDQPQIVVLQ